MATNVYVQSGSAQGLGNGTSWENCYGGIAGLRTAIAAIVNATNTNIYIRGVWNLESIEDDDPFEITKAGTISNNTKLCIIGCDSNGDEIVNVGTYVRFCDLSETSGLTYIFDCHTLTRHTIEFRNIWSEDTAQINYQGKEVRYINCHFDGYVQPLSSNYITFVQCDMANTANSLAMIDVYKFDSICSLFTGPVTNNPLIQNAYNINVFGSLISGWRTLVENADEMHIVLNNNVFMNQTNVIESDFVTDVVAFNNLFYNPTTIFYGSGYEQICEDFNATSLASGLYGAHDIHNVAFPFINESDWRIQSGSSLYRKGTISMTDIPGETSATLGRMHIGNDLNVRPRNVRLR